MRHKHDLKTYRITVKFCAPFQWVSIKFCVCIEYYYIYPLHIFYTRFYTRIRKRYGRNCPTVERKTVLDFYRLKALYASWVASVAHVRGVSFVRFPRPWQMNFTLNPTSINFLNTTAPWWKLFGFFSVIYRVSNTQTALAEEFVL